ncbi:VWA domain-containing protein [Pimelobacter simplex]|uniref:DUF7927 domain-containing protein n=1 Tax=Nocardioides simplex TaxID=2045 RepID=UPI003AAF6CF8
MNKPVSRGAPRVGWTRRSLALLLLAGLLSSVPVLSAPTVQAVVPDPTATTAVISVKVGGDRQADDTVAGLAGVTLALHGPGTASSGAGNPTTQGAAGPRYDAAWSWTTCTSDADGDCSFVIPIRAGATPSATGVQQDTRFWVVEESGPAGWYANPQMRLGSFQAAPEFAWAYRFRTGDQLRANTTYRSTTTLPVAADWNAATEPDRGFMRNLPDDNAEGGMGSNIGRTTGRWSQSRTNPALPAKCGLKVALVTDTSGSLDPVVGGPGIQAVQNAMGTFVDAFRGTPTRMSLFSFSRTSPGSGATNAPALLPVTTAGQAATFKAQYASWVAGGGTNWDRGLAAAAGSGNTYDLVVLLTDGNPTVYGDDPGPRASAFNSFQDVDAGIFAANQLKAAGSRVVALGVGSAISSAPSAYNLRAISGTTEDTDFFRVADFSEAASVLSDLAKANCQGSIEVRKMIVPTGGTIAQATPAPAGWTFAAGTTAPGVAVPAPATASTVAGGDGRVSFGLSFTSPTTSGPVQVLETQQSGYAVVPVGTGPAARNATCTNTVTGAPVAVTDAGTTANPGFTVDGVANAQIACTIYNTPLPAPAALEVEKAASPASGTAVAPGGFVDYTLTFRNTGGSPAAVDHTDHLAGVLDDATLVAGPTSSNANLTATTQGTPVDRFRVVGTVPAGATYTVTYRVQAKTAAFGDGRLDNFVRPTGTNPPATCLPANRLCTTHPIPGALTPSKSSNPASGTPLAPGSSATYTLRFENTGGQPVAVDHDDVLTHVLDDADVANIQTSNPALTAVLAGDRISITGSVPAGAAYTVTYTVTVPDPVKAGGNGVLNNYLVPDGATPPSTCVAATGLCTTHPVPGDVTVAKAVTTASSPVRPGDQVGYTLTFTHSGGLPAVVDYTDDLAGVLDDAVLVGGPTAGAGLTATLSGTAPNQTLHVTGTIARGAPVTVTYTVQVKTSGLADGSLDNCVTEAAPGTDQDCTSTPVPGRLEVLKSSDPVTGTAVVPGQAVGYTLTFTNTGGRPVTVDHTDLLADVLDDATITAGPTATGGLTVTPSPLGSATSFDVDGTLAPGATATVTYTATVKTTGLGDGRLGNFLVPSGQNPPAQCTPATGAGTTCTTHPVPGALGVTKTSDPVSTTPLTPGQVVTYTLTFANGGGAAAAVDHTDHLAAVLDDADLVPGSLTAQPGLTATLAGDGQSFRVTGSVAGGASLTVTYQVEVKAAGFGDGRLDNYVRPTGTTPPTSCLPADRLCTTHPVPGALTVVKDSDPVSGTTVAPGGQVTYAVVLTNTGGRPVAVDHTDHLAGVLDDAVVTTAPAFAGASHGLTLTPAADRFTLTGDLPAGTAVRVTYTVTVKTSGFGDGTLLNVVRPGTEQPPTGPCAPGDALCTEHPIAGKLDVVKSSDPADGSTVAPGDEVDYTLTFRNTGGRPVAVDHTDLLAELLDDATVTTDPASSDPALTVSPSPLGAAQQFTVTGLVPAGATYTVTYTATVKQSGFGDGVLTNVVVKTGDTPPATCQTGDPLCTEHPVAGRLKVVKSSDPAPGTPVAPGADVAYTLTFENTGGSPVGVDHVDHLAAVLDDATLTAGPSAQAPLTATLAGDGQSFAVTGSLPAGATATVTYTVQVKAAGFGDGNLLNVVRRTGVVPPTDCATGDELCTEHPVPGRLDVVKSSDPADGTAVRPGATIDYTLTFRHSGGQSVPVDFTDDLSELLDDASVTTDPVSSDPDLTVDPSPLGGADSFTVTGTLGGEKTVRITYRVTVKAAADMGDGVLTNVLVETGTTPPSTCAPGDPLCTEHPVPGRLDVAKSSDPVTGSVVEPGAAITYRLRFANTGGRAVAVDHVDHLAKVLDDTDLTAAPAIVGADGGLSVSAVADEAFRVTGDLAPGAEVVVAYTVTVKRAGRGDSVLLNFLTPGGQQPPATCEPTTTLCTEHPVTEIKAVKSVDPATGSRVLPGQVLTYRLTFTNAGGTTAPVRYADHLGGVLDDAVVTTAPYVVGGGSGLALTAIEDQVLTIGGTLAAGATAVVAYQVTVKTSQRGDSVLTNFLMGDDGEIPPTSCPAPNGVCTQNPVGQLAVTKSSDPVSGTKVREGDTVRYLLTFTNRGAAPHDVDYTDRLRDVLDDAVLTSLPRIDGAAHGLQVSPLTGDRFTVTGRLAAGRTVTVSYAVRVHETGRGDHLLVNFLTEGTTKPPATCVPKGASGATCTVHPVTPTPPTPTGSDDPPGGWLPNAGGPSLLLLLAGLLALGGGLFFVTRRRAVGD